MVQPYRYQYFDEGQQALVGKLIKKAELNRSKLANAWVTFENLVFEEIQQEIVLLLCDPHRLNLPTKQIDFHADKWTYYFLDKEELEFLGRVRCENMPKIGKYANVEVGITTGANGYFTVPQSIVDLYQLQEYARPMVGRSVQVNSLCFTTEDWKRNLNIGAKANLLVFPPKVKEEGGDGVKAYIESGEQQGINKGYKTSIRDDWYVIPSIKLSQALFLRRNNLYPKFVLNEAQAYTTDTMHRVFINEGVNHKAFVVSYYNSLSFAFAEILGRNFGGGVLELMPSEVEGIYLPYREANAELFDKVDQMVREKKTADEILDFTDKELLQKGMGFSEKETKMARSIWYKLMGRRLNRETLEKAAPEEKNEIKKAVARVKQLNFFDVLQQYPENIVENAVPEPPKQQPQKLEPDVDESKNVLICLVKNDNVERYLDQSAKIYYTGKKFPSTVALNKLYYFMPYIKRKGIRDLYLIKIARVGTRKEGQPDNDPNDFRLVFEIEFVKKLFKDYKPVELEIWHTFTDTTTEELLERFVLK